MDKPNFLVHDLTANLVTDASTTDEVYDLLDHLPSGHLYKVTSPTGQDVTEFVLF